MPSPHFERQGPLSHLGSSSQSRPQPSPRMVLPSSQGSEPSGFPSPHLVALQVDGGDMAEFVHTKPGCTIQLAQPSFGSSSPSSHSSLPAMMPSPHLVSR